MQVQAIMAAMTDPGMDALTAAAAAGLARDAIWRDKPPLAAGCDHDLRCLPCIEYRQTVLCAKCGGLDAALSQAVAAAPSAFIIHEDGRIARKFTLKRRDSAEAAGRLRAMGMPEDIIAEITPGQLPSR
jgi:hypothetical protein